MASAAQQNDDEGGQYHKPDAKLAFSIYRKEIAPRLTKAAEERGETAEPYKRIKDQAHFPKPILNFIVMLDDLEDYKRDHYLIAMREGLKEKSIFMPSDLVTQAQGIERSEVIPFGERAKPSLATIPVSKGKDDDLAGEGDTDTETYDFVQSNPPRDARLGQSWLDTTTDPSKVKYWTGSEFSEEKPVGGTMKDVEEVRKGTNAKADNTKADA